MKITKRTVKQFRDKFIELNDPIGVEFANLYTKGYSGLQKLMNYIWFRNEWDKWQDDLRATIKSKALERIREIAEEGSAQSLPAAKYLANGEYLDEKQRRGRPSKEEVKGELKRQVQLIDEVTEDYKRMTGLSVIQGGRANSTK